MRRKVIKLASNTLVVSLPTKWVQANNIEKGEEMEITPKQHMLLLTRASSKAGLRKKIKLDLTGMNATLVWNYLDAVYRAGFDEIEIYFPQQEIINIKNRKKIKTTDLISRITDKLIGMEIIRQSKNTITLTEITSLKEYEYTNILNRIFLSLRNIASDIHNATSKSDKETLENIHLYSEVNINKLSDYCMRILNREGLDDFKISNTNYTLTFLLEEIGDVYADIARNTSEKKIKSSNEFLNMLKKTNDLLELTHKNYLEFKLETYITVHEKRNEYKQQIDFLKTKNTKEQDLFFFLKMILDKLMEANNTMVTASKQNPEE